MRFTLLVLTVVGIVIALAGCSGTTSSTLAPTANPTTTSTSTTSPTTTTTTSTTDAAQMGKVSISIAWPQQPTAKTRMIPLAATSMVASVTGPGIVAAVTGTITRPNSSTTLLVPAGAGRTVTLTSYDSANNPLSHGFADNVDVPAGGTVSTPIIMGGMEDPNSGVSPALVTFTSGVYTTEAIIDSRQYSIDTFSFNTTAGQSYTFSFECLEVAQAPNPTNTGALRFNWSDNLSSYATTSWDPGTGKYSSYTRVFNAATSGPITVTLFPWNFNYGDIGTPIFRYRITVYEGGTGSVGVSGS